jgi:hypothetical protein
MCAGAPARQENTGVDFRDQRTLTQLVAGVSIISAALSGLAGGASVATLLALAGTLLSIATLWRLRTHYILTEAAERSEMVGLSAIVQRYVPGELQSHKTSEEIAIVKQVISLRWTRWKWAAIVLGALMLFSAATTAYFTRRNMEFVAKADPAVHPRPNLDAARTLHGVWGWRADYQQSCSQNPQTISVSPDGRKVILDYAKPYRSQQHFEYSVVSIRPNVMELRGLNAEAAANQRQVVLTITFQDANTFLLTNSAQPLAAYGVIERCR